MLMKNLKLTTAIIVILMVTTWLVSGTMAISPGLQTGPLFESPLPTPTLSPSPIPWPTISPDLSNTERALRFVSQRQDVPQETLRLVDTFTTQLPLTDVTLWRGLALDTQSKTRPLYEVYIHEGTKEILTGSKVDPLTFWQVEEIAFREQHKDDILDLVARREKVAAEKLEIANGYLRQDPRTEQMVWEGKINNVAQGQGYVAAVDEQGQEVDIQELEKADAEARRAKYGKLAPKLYYLLSTLAPEEKVKVLLWIGQVDYAWVDEELGRRYPQVEADRFTGGWPVVGEAHPVPVDPELFEKVRASYNDLLVQAHHKAAESVATFLRGKGYEVEVLDIIPGIEAELPVSAIQELNWVELDNLFTIYHSEIETIPEMDSVGQTIQIQAAWDSGYTGVLPICNGVTMRLGMMDAGIVPTDTTHPAFQRKTIIVPDPDDTDDPHAAQVAAVMFGDDSRYPERRGIAYGSTDLVTVQHLSHSNFQALVNNGAFVINVSISTSDAREMEWSDREVDYVVRYWDPTIVVSAGKIGATSNVRSPGKAYNAITVGAFEDNNTPYWHDDSMYNSSAYIDPYVDGSSSNAHRKPDVAAVGADVTTAADNYGDAYVRTWGTSVAAPQVSGLAALLIQRYCFLGFNPEAMKAIIMASAIHNIEGNARLSDKDGAGGIVANEAIAVFDRGGWAHHIIGDINDPNDPTNPFNGSGSYYDFKGSDTGIWDVGSTQAYAGERIRATLCWNSNPTGNLGNPGTDKLSSDLDLRAIAPNGQQVAFSNSSRNSCEILDFIANQSGEYKMRVHYYHRSQESLNLGLGLAWLRIPRTFLPDIRASHNGWDSAMYIRNDSAEYANVTINLYDTGGDLVDTNGYPANYSIAPNAQLFHMPKLAGLSGWQGSAVVEASEDVSVVVESQYGSAQAVTNYTGILPTGQGSNPGWGQASTTLYAPTIKRNWYGRTIDLHIMNAGSSTANVTITYYNDSGNQVGGSQTCTLSSLASCIKTPSSGNLLTAKITANQPIVGVAVERPHSGSQTKVGAYNLLANGAQILYHPAMKKDWYGHTNGLRVQNTGSSGTNVTFTYYQDGSGNTYTSGPYYIPARGTYTVYQDPNLPSSFVGTVKINSSSQNIVAQMHEEGAQPSLSTSAFQQGSSASYTPRLCNNCGGWYAGISIQNVGSAAADVTVTYYNTAGSQVGAPQSYNNIGVGRGKIIFTQIPAGGPYSAVLTADQPIVTTVNFVAFTENEDKSMSYNAPNR